MTFIEFLNVLGSVCSFFIEKIQLIFNMLLGCYPFLIFCGVVLLYFIIDLAFELFEIPYLIHDRHDELDKFEQYKQKSLRPYIIKNYGNQVSYGKDSRFYHTTNQVSSANKNKQSVPDTPDWFGKDIQSTPISKEEKEQLDSIIKSFDIDGSIKKVNIETGEIIE